MLKIGQIEKLPHAGRLDTLPVFPVPCLSGEIVYPFGQSSGIEKGRGRRPWRKVALVKLLRSLFLLLGAHCLGERDGKRTNILGNCAEFCYRCRFCKRLRTCGFDGRGLLLRLMPALPIEEHAPQSDEGHDDGGNQAVALHSAHVIIVCRMRKFRSSIVRRTGSPSPTFRSHGLQGEMLCRDAPSCSLSFSDTTLGRWCA